MCVIHLRLFNVLNLHLGQVKVIYSVCILLAYGVEPNRRFFFFAMSNVWEGVPTEVKEGCPEQEVLRGMLEMDNQRRLRRKNEAFNSSIEEARAAQLGDLLSSELA